MTRSKSTIKLSELRVGDRLTADASFTCMKAGDVRDVKYHENGGLYIECSHGRHYLEAQAIHDGSLVGLTVV